VLGFVAKRAVTFARAMDEERSVILESAMFDANADLCPNCALPILRVKQNMIKCTCNKQCEIVLFCQQTTKCKAARNAEHLISCSGCSVQYAFQHSENMLLCKICLNLTRFFCEQCCQSCDVCDGIICNKHAKICPDCYDTHCSFNCFEKHNCY